MKLATIVGIVLIVLGVAALVLGGITYTTQETVLEVGPLKAQAEKEETIPLPPLLGAIALIGGIVLVVVGARRR
jgi:drug/metabolite transporter (DMT)-like permease